MGKQKKTPTKDTGRTLQSLTTSRTRFRAQIESTLASVEGLHSAEPKCADGGSPDAISLFIREVLDKIRVLDDAIAGHPDLPEEEIDEQRQESDEFELRVCRAAASLDAAYRRGAGGHDNSAYFTPARPRVRFAGDPTEDTPARNSVPEFEIPQPAQRPSTIVLRNSKEFDSAQRPEIFAGDRLKFRTFIKQFEIFIAKNTNASDCERLIALRKFVSGEPKLLVDSLELSDANYPVALSILEENYSRVDVDKERLLTELRNLQRINNINDIPALRKLIIKVQTNTRVLEGLGIEISSLAVMLQSSLAAALPPALRQMFKQWRRIELAQRLPQAPAPDGVSAGTSAPAHSVLEATPAHRLFATATPRRDWFSSTPAARAGDANAVASDVKTPFEAVEDPVSELQRTVGYILQHIRDYEDSGYLENALSSAKNKEDDHSTRKSGNSKKLIATVAATHQKTHVGNNMRAIRPCLFCKTADHNSSRCPASMTIEKRKELLTKQKRCFRCFRSQHARPGECRGPRVTCSVCGSAQHYTSMHAPETQPPTPETPSSSNVVGAVSEPKGPTIMQTARALLVSGARKTPIRVFVDQGSGLTFMLPSTRQLLVNAHAVSRKNLNIETFSSSEVFPADRFCVVLQSTHDPQERVTLYAFERDYKVNPQNLLSSSARQAVKDFAANHALADPSLLNGGSSDMPALIIGMDQAYRILTLDPPRMVDGELVALNSRLGWIIGGPLPPPQQRAAESVSAVHSVCCVTTLSQLSTSESPAPPAPTAASLSGPAQLMENLWRTDAIGISDQASASPLTADESSALRQFFDGLRYDGKRYTVEFPKRETIDRLTSNRNVALRRLESKLRQLRRDPEKHKRYHEELMKFIKDGHAVEVETSAVGGPDVVDGTYHMPHHEVITSKEAGDKWRIVFDCSAKDTSKKSDHIIPPSSLNDHLLPGPNLNADLVTLLINFRLHAFAVSADIRGAYMRIGLAESDRDRFRFLWTFPGEEKVRTFRMVKVTWGAASSGFLLAAVIREHLKKVEADVGEQLGKHLYADDYLQSFSCEEGAIEMVDKLRNALNSADMSLAKWKTNSEMVSRHLLSTGVDSSEFQLNSRDLFKVLGIVWSPADDYLSFHIPPVTDRLSSRTRITKRNALSIVASVYDPLGFLIPFTLRGKLLLQKLWSVNLQWDDCIPDRQRTELIEWVNELQELQHIRVRRHYSSSKQTAASYHLHVLGDASPSAYACCAYIEYRESDGRSTTSLIMCKSRLAPIDSALTLPRLELLAALIATRLKVFLVERIDVEFESVRFYTDSSITYHWITGSKPGQWKAYVHNRVAEIQKNSSPDQWYLVEGEMNIADLGTRGVPAKVLRTSSAWWNGPDWLRLPVEQQPVSRPGIDGGSLQVVQDELRFSAAPAVAVSGEPLLNLDLFNSAYHAIRVMANVLRFVGAARRLPSLKIAESHRAASIRLIRTVQAQHFAGEIAAILCGDRPPRDSKIGSFRLFVDGDQVLRAKTRLTEGPHFSYEEMNPVIIPGESRFALLLIYDAHRVNAHFGVSVVLSQLRRRFWITRGRQIIKAVLGKCAVCKRRSGRPATQVEAPLPSPRVTLIAPFQTTGIDFCGPFYTRTSEGAQKVYICVFSCASTRAVHLELTPYMSTPQTHLAIRRFLAEHPACTRFISDNGRSFVRAATDVKRMINSVHNLELKNLLEARSIDWIFNCPRSPWHGGFFERMVGTTKSALKKTLGKSLVSFEELRTIVKELAAVINDRPITYVESGIDSPAPLTPSQLIHGGPYVRTLASLTPLDQLGPNGAISGGDLRASLAERTNYFKSLSLRWYREYILQLRSAQHVRGSVSKGIAIGDVCLLKEENVSRIQWPLVRIEECHTGRDGNPRTYTIRTANGKTTRRAAQLLIPLEVVDNPPVSTPATEEAESTE